MSLISKFAVSIFSGSNENTAARANIKFDFALVKAEALTEVFSLGTALASRRKTEAEDGVLHKTARRLGALFEQMIPSTPKLITAYGLRVSEIVETPGINAQGSEKHGPF